MAPENVNDDRVTVTEFEAWELDLDPRAPNRWHIRALVDGHLTAARVPAHVAADQVKAEGFLVQLARQEGYVT